MRAATSAGCASEWTMFGCIFERRCDTRVINVMFRTSRRHAGDHVQPQPVFVFVPCTVCVTVAVGLKLSVSGMC